MTTKEPQLLIEDKGSSFRGGGTSAKPEGSLKPTPPPPPPPPKK